MGENLPPIFFRLDFSPEIGAGHAVRCGALAVVLHDLGVRTSLVTTSRSASRRDWRCAGFSKIIRIAASPGDSPLPACDAELTLKQALNAGSRCMVVDHYGAGAEYFARLKAGGLKVAVIDDVGGRDFRAADWLLNQNIEAKKISYRLRPGCHKLLGPEFALLCKQFVARIQNRLARRPKILCVLVTLGGGDTAKLSARVLEAIAKVESPIQVCCVANGPARGLALLKRTAKNFRHPIKLRPVAPNAAELMARADIAVCAGGSTCWEFCALGVPMLVFALAANQKGNAIGLDKAGCAKYLGSPFHGAKRLPQALQELVQDPARRRAMSGRGRALVDGCGAARAARSLIEMSNDLQ